MAAPDTAHTAIIDGRVADSRDTLYDLALHLFGEIESVLDKQIYPEQARDEWSAPDSREYTVTLTAGDWRRYGQAMHALETAALGREVQ